MTESSVRSGIDISNVMYMCTYKTLFKPPVLSIVELSHALVVALWRALHAMSAAFLTDSWRWRCEVVVSACAEELHQYSFLLPPSPPSSLSSPTLLHLLAHTHTHTSWLYLNVIPGPETQLPQLGKVVSYLPNLSPH